MLNILDCEYSFNYASGGQGLEWPTNTKVLGGAIYSEKTMNISSTIFYNNSCDQFILDWLISYSDYQLQGGAVFFNKPTDIYNCTFYNNTINMTWSTNGESDLLKAKKKRSESLNGPSLGEYRTTTLRREYSGCAVASSDTRGGYITNCTFTDNYGPTSGAVAFVGSDPNSENTIINSTFNNPSQQLVGSAKCFGWYW